MEGSNSQQLDPAGNPWVVQKIKWCFVFFFKKATILFESWNGGFVCNLSTQKAEVGESWVQDQPERHLRPSPQQKQNCFFSTFIIWYSSFMFCHTEKAKKRNMANIRHHIRKKIKKSEVGRTDRWVQMPASKHDHLSSIPTVHQVEENWFPQSSSETLCMCPHIHTSTYTTK